MYKQIRFNKVFYAKIQNPKREQLSSTGKYYSIGQKNLLKMQSAKIMRTGQPKLLRLQHYFLLSIQLDSRSKLLKTKKLSQLKIQLCQFPQATECNNCGDAGDNPIDSWARHATLLMDLDSKYCRSGQPLGINYENYRCQCLTMGFAQMLWAPAPLLCNMGYVHLSVLDTRLAR